MRLALIGNCSYQALIDDRATVRWLCWPRFDSSFVFGSLLDEKRGGDFTIAAAGDTAKIEQSYLRHTNVLRTTFRSSDGEFEVTDFAPRYLQYDRSFKPTMLVRKLRPISGNPFVRISCQPVYHYGDTVPAHYAASNHIGWILSDAQLRLTTNAPLTYVQTGKPFALDRDLYLVLTWGQPLEASLVETCEAFLSRTIRYWKTWVNHAAIPDLHQEEVIRSALALKLHQFEDTGAITAATTTSIPEHPGSGRNWDYRYCWPRDTYFTVSALRRLGHYEEMERFVGYLINLAQKPHELQPLYGIGGETRLEERILDSLAGYRGSGPVRIGNAAYTQDQHDIYGELVAAIAPLFVDVRFRENIGPWAPGLLSGLLERIDATLEAPDAGLWEKRDEPRLHTFSLLMHWAGATAAQAVGRSLGDLALLKRGQDLAERARSIIEDRCWREEPGFYADAVVGDHADASLFLMINSGYLRDSPERATRHVEALADQLQAADHLLYRYRHDDGIGSTSATFTVCGFWYAEALARIGQMDRARNVFDKLLTHANHVGLFSEDIDPTTGELWGNFPQTYSHVGIINTAFALSPPGNAY